MAKKPTQRERGRAREGVDLRLESRELVAGVGERPAHHLRIGDGARAICRLLATLHGE